jgi:hypothetical protein
MTVRKPSRGGNAPFMARHNMSHVVEFQNVSTIGLESSPVAAALAGLVMNSRPLEATEFQVDNIRIAYVFYESGLSINVMYTVDDAKKRAVGFKLSEGMDVPRSSPSGSSSPGRSRSWPASSAGRSS